MVTREQLHRMIDELTDEQVAEAADALAGVRHEHRPEADGKSEMTYTPPTPAEIRARYGTPAPIAGTPLSYFDRFVGKIFPEDESADDFDATIRRLRDEGGHGRLPD